MNVANLKDQVARIQNYCKRTINQAVIRYYKAYGSKIFETKSIICDPASEYEIHMLVREEDFFISMWCLKTFYYFSDIRPILIIHDDGSLTAQSINMYKKHFEGCKVILKRDADILMKEYLKEYEYCLKFRFSGRMHRLVMSLKLFDYEAYSSTKKILMLDSDVLFYQKPVHIIRCMRSDKGCFMSDYKNSYAKSLEKLSALYDIKVTGRVNAGLVYLPLKEFYTLDFLEAYLRKAYENNVPITERIEQTAWAMFISNNLQLFERLPKSYQISSQPLTRETISHHYVCDGSRKNLYKHGLKHFKKTKFIREFNKCL